MKSMLSSMKAWILKHIPLMSIAAAAFAIIAIVIVLLLIYYNKSLPKNPICDINTILLRRLQGLTEYSLEEIRLATFDFEANHRVRYGSLGPIYVGILQRRVVAIKILTASYHPRFLAEVYYQTKIRHRNVVSILGYCCENGHKMIVYECMVHGSDVLNLKKRISIALGAAKGLQHMHSLTPPLSHNRFTTAKVLLDAKFEAKVSDSGWSRQVEMRNGGEANDDDLEVGLHIPEAFDGTSDVYSFAEVRRAEFHRVLRMMRRCFTFPANQRPKMEEVVTELQEIYMSVLASEQVLSQFSRRVDGFKSLAMAPSRSKKSKYKKTPRGKAVSPQKEEESMTKTKQRKRKLSDMLGPQWSKEELERFYDGYRKFGKEWKKVAAFVHSRSADMVEALYTMNKAYLSLPEGTASVVGLNAMMTDHYSVLHGGSDSEQDKNEGIKTLRPAPKRSKVKSSDHPSKGLEGLSDRLQFRSSSGYLPSLKKRRTETAPRAVGKRTPRIPISYTPEKDTKRSLNQKGDDTDDDMEHEIAKALTEASQRGGSTRNSHTPNRKAKMYSPDRKDERMRADIDLAISKLRATDMEDARCEPSLGSTEADNSGGRNELTHGEGSSAVDLQHKGKKYYRRRLGIKEDDAKEACSGTDEAQSLSTLDEKFEPEGDGKRLKFTYKSSRRKSKKSLFTADEDTACDALQTLADLSLMMPETATDTESSVQAEEKRAGKASVSDYKGTDPASMSKRVSLRNPKPRRSFSNDLCNTEVERKSPSSSVIRKGRQKASPTKVPKDELAAISQVIEPPKNKGIGEGNEPVGRGKRSAIIRNSHEKKSVKPQDRTSSSNNIVEEDESAPSTAVTKKQVNLPTKVRSRRKIITEKPLTIDDVKNSEILEKFSHCISSFRARRWCLFEWFYSAIDYPWFARQEFVEYLDHVGLGHVPRLTRVEWGVIRSSLGKPRRFSQQFLKEEKEKLNLYRDSVRKHYDELNTGTREGLPMDLARPLNVSQRVISIHPKSREIHDGSVLTVDHCRYRIQFDHPELGVEFVKNPSEEKMHERVKESMPEGYLKLSCETGHPLSSPNYNISSSLKQEKVDISSSDPQAQNGVDEALGLQLFNPQPSSSGHIHAREADVQALSELTRALDKKELVLRELKCMNNEVVESQKDAQNALKDSESFKKQYAAILFQLSEINEQARVYEGTIRIILLSLLHSAPEDSYSMSQYAQVSLALLGLRQRNTYQENVPYTSIRPMSKSGEPDDQLTCLDNYASDTNGFHVWEIVDSSRKKARKMVHRAVQALALLRKDKNNVVNIEEAIDFVNSQLSVDQTEGSSVQQMQAAQDQRLPSTSNPPSSTHADGSHVNPLDQNDLQIPSELVSRCMATLLMIQRCTERQFPPSEVAQVLDSAVASLQPCCSQNLPIYTEIQKCMGIIRNQILALVPS
ncbi:unnamed protein product [Thlaspi arvense]|uniref:Protein kinase domain-containing protein n=1 Tax=Thlaspi arvense TaxID=13288 RepID=A0AAU9S1U2_THLAR|nr:unnamed protein product [Thlaspi arvense]